MTDASRHVGPPPAPSLPMRLFDLLERVGLAAAAADQVADSEPIDVGSLAQVKELDVKVRYFKAKHSPDVPNAVGVRITFGENSEFVLGFSGDTSYFDELCKDDKLGDCDLLIAHISQPDSTELVDENADLKQYHLGYRGTAKLIQGAKPKLTVIGEFWAGLADLRIDLVNGLRSLCKTDAIIPSSRSLRLDPRDLTIQCTSCKNFKEHSKILVAPAQVAFGPLSYVCDDCRIM